MRRSKRGPFVVLLLALLTACEAEEAEVEMVGGEAANLPQAGAVEYDPDTLAFVQAARPLQFNEREWWPLEEPVFDPLVVPVGTVEGIVVYATADDTIPYDRLYIPAEGRRWMVLEPRAPLP